MLAVAGMDVRRRVIGRPYRCCGGWQVLNSLLRRGLASWLSEPCPCHVHVTGGDVRGCSPRAAHML